MKSFTWNSLICWWVCDTMFLKFSFCCPAELNKIRRALVIATPQRPIKKLFVLMTHFLASAIGNKRCEYSDCLSSFLYFKIYFLKASNPFLCIVYFPTKYVVLNTQNSVDCNFPPFNCSLNNHLILGVYPKRCLLLFYQTNGIGMNETFSPNFPSIFLATYCSPITTQSITLFRRTLLHIECNDFCTPNHSEHLFSPIPPKISEHISL